MTQPVLYITVYCRMEIQRSISSCVAGQRPLKSSTMLSPMAYRSIFTRCLRSSSNYNIPSCATRIQISPPSQALSNHLPQRRSSSSSSSSSSKPSNIPPHGARVVSQRQETPSRTSDETQFDGGRRSTTRLGRRKVREAAAAEASLRGQKEFLRNLPCVPTTSHVHPAGELLRSWTTCMAQGNVANSCTSDIAISDFFSLHRPISVTSSVPTAANASSFEGIFRSASEPVNSSEVISTISTAISTLEASPQQPQDSRSYDNTTDNEFRAAIASISTSNGGAVNHLDDNHNDKSPSLELFGQLLSARYRPFVPPPVPAPSNINDPNNNTSSESSLSSSTSSSFATIRRKTYSTFLTILEATHSNGFKTYKAYTSPIMTEDLSSSSSPSTANIKHGSISSPTPTAFLERMWLRQQRWDEYRSSREDRMWEAISVKRQRRLKMKKHKYKKLMRRTRHVRRRMENA